MMSFLYLESIFENFLDTIPYYLRQFIFHGKCSYISIQVLEIIQLLYGFRVWMAGSKHAGMLRELRKARRGETRPF
jgi:hypothetical protein